MVKGKGLQGGRLGREGWEGEGLQGGRLGREGWEARGEGLLISLPVSTQPLLPSPRFHSYSPGQPEAC